jgi:endonuclease/exonuclease/phosphatase family metal-dependent hydrolase
VLLRLATFNLESLDWSRDQEAWFQTRANTLRPILAALQADILCLQEVNAQHLSAEDARSFVALTKLIEGTDCADFHLAHSRRPGGDDPADRHNLAILSRWPIVAQRQFHHDLVQPLVWKSPEGEEITISFDRPALYAKITPPDESPLHVFNLHLRAPRAAPMPDGRREGQWTSTRRWAEGYFVASLKRQAQALEIRLAVEDLLDQDPGARIALCGDFNAEAFEAPTRLLQALPDDVETHHFAQRALVPLEAGLPAERRFSVVHDGRPVLLDHILASSSLAQDLTGIEAFNEDLQDEAHVEGPIAGSLHAPLLAIFGDGAPSARPD